MHQYLYLLSDILQFGTRKKTRAGNTISTFNQNLSHEMTEGFPLLTTKKIEFKNIVIEMLWFLGGDRHWDFLHKHGVHFWDSWNEGNSIDGPGILPEAYGEYWRRYPYFKYVPAGAGADSEWYPEEYSQLFFDQFKAIIDGLKKDKDNRRLVLDRWYAPCAWMAKLPPCFFASIFNTQYGRKGNAKLCLHNIGRSVDTPVGLPYNLAGFSLLLELVSHLVGIPAGTIAFSMTDCHIYENQIGGVEEQIGRIPGKLPTLKINNLKSLEDVDALIRDGTTEQIMGCFELLGYEPQSFIKFPVAV